MRSTSSNSSGPGLLGDDLAEQRAEQPDLERERVARAGRPDAGRLGARRPVPVAPRPLAGHGRPRSDRYRSRGGTRRNLSAAEPFVRLYGDGHGDVPDRRLLDRRASAPGTPATGPDQLEQLRFLHEVARLATTARTWDELLETVVDGTRDALHADVSSLYLLDRDGAYLTLAATNGLDRFQIGRARVPFGEGVTGRVAAQPRAARSSPTSRPIRASCGSAASTSAASSPRCSACR